MPIWIHNIGIGRLVVAGVLAFYGFALAVLLGVAGLWHVPILNGLGVAALDVPFMDLHGVTAWCKADSQGIDPASSQTNIQLPDGSMHPNFLMNYPPAVLWLRHVGLMPDRVLGIGILLGVLYAASAFCLMGRIGLSHGFLWAGLLVSPLSLLVVERANLDIVVFACFAFALMMRGNLLLSGATILIAGLLKLYPGAGFSAIWMSGKRNARLWTVVFCGGLILYFLTLLPRLSAISGSLQDQSKSCFGADVSVDILLARGVLEPSLAAPASSGMKSLALIATMIGIGGGLFFRKSFSGISISERSLFAFWLAAPMSIVLFILSNQMDYKWIFLLFLVPSVLELMQADGRCVRFLAKTWLAALAVYSYWTFFSGEESLRNAILKQIVMWVGFLATSVLVGVMLVARRISCRTCP